MDKINFSFSDTIAGYVVDYDKDVDSFHIRTSDEREFTVKFSKKAYAWIANNLNEPRQWCGDQMRGMLSPGRFLFVYGVFYNEGGGFNFEAQYLIFLGRKPDEYDFEKRDWWVRQIRALGEFYLLAQFQGKEINYDDYRTTIKITGEKEKDNYRQETDTISRLVYGFATAYMLTGDDRFLEAAEKGTEYLREHMRFYDLDENIVYWYHGIDVHGRRETKIFASEFGDDFNAIPAYEQIYALAGPIQTYRITGDPRILQGRRNDRRPVRPLLPGHEAGGAISPTSTRSRWIRAAKPWARTGPRRTGTRSATTRQPIWSTFIWPRARSAMAGCWKPPSTRSPSTSRTTTTAPSSRRSSSRTGRHDYTHMWQQNRGVIGHNLKIAWNLMRMHGEKPKPEYEAFARKIAEVMPAIGGDPQRGGWYDVMERKLGPNEERHRFGFHDRKAWWQQEQGILAYLILRGVLGGEEYLKFARESSAFYNAFFLDHDDGAVYFNVLANGMPYLMGTERLQGQPLDERLPLFRTVLSRAGIHQPADHPATARAVLQADAEGFKRTTFCGSRRISCRRGACGWRRSGSTVEPYNDFDAERMTVKLPQTDRRVQVKVLLQPQGRP